jgi:excinuclease UvrABC nuclease subunit
MDFINELVPIKDDFLHTLPRYAVPSMGVYFLFYNNTLIYIGQSKQILIRVSNHFYTKNFTSFSFVKCNKISEAEILEREFIKKFNPPLNKYLKSEKDIDNSIHYFYKGIVRKEFETSIQPLILK